jgi:hypothetical protein
VKRSRDSGSGGGRDLSDQRGHARRKSERRGAQRVGSERRQGDRRAGVLAALTVASFAIAPTLSADIYTRVNSRGVVEATNVPDRDFKLTYRSKGTLVHSAGFLLHPSANNEFDPEIEAAATLHGVRRELIRAIIQAESGFDRLATSTKGAQGLMQLMPATARRFGVTDSFDARQNVLAGAQYLRFLLDIYRGDVSLSAAAYNAGEEAVAHFNGIPPFKETQDYVRTVNAILGASIGGPASLIPAMFITPGGGVGTITPGSGAPAVKLVRPRVYYRWTDARGVVHMAQAPPAEGQYTTIRSGE